MAKPGTVKTGEWYMMPAGYRRAHGHAVEVVRALPVHKCEDEDMRGERLPGWGEPRQFVHIRTTSGHTTTMCSTGLRCRASEAQTLKARRRRALSRISRIGTLCKTLMEDDGVVLTREDLAPIVRVLEEGAGD